VRLDQWLKFKINEATKKIKKAIDEQLIHDWHSTSAPFFVCSLEGYFGKNIAYWVVV
jgi:hypothetical protein